MSQCVKCHKYRNGRAYTFHIGVVTDRSVTYQAGSTTTTTRYRLFAAQQGFLCTVCTARHLAFRLFGPVLLGLGLEMGAFYGFDPLGFQIDAGAVPLVLLAAFVLQLVAFTAVPTTAGARGPGQDDGPAGCLTTAGGVLAVIGGMLALFGGLVVTGLAMDLSTGRHALFAAPDPDMAGFYDWLAGIIVGCQLAVYLNVWAGRQLLLENKVWRCRKRTLRSELDEPTLVGFTTARYNALRKN